MQIVVGHSIDPDTEGAIEELLESCRVQLDGCPPRAGVLWAAIDHDHARLLAALHDAFPGLELIGCTTDGELSSREGFQEGSVAVLLIAGDGVTFAAGVGRDLSVDPAHAGQQAIAAASARLGGPPVLCLTTPESLTASADAMLAGLQAALGPAVPIFGGIAGDQSRFKRTLQFCGREVLTDAVPVLLAAGGLRLSHGIASGWRPLGAVAEVVSARGSQVFQIGEHTALGFYQHYLGEHAIPSHEFPLLIEPGDDGRQVLRAPMGHDRVHGSVTFAGEVPVGARVQLTTGTRDEVVAATESALAQALAAYPGGRPSAALVFTCAARKQLLGTRVGEESTLLRAGLKGLPLAGFYAYGELAPLQLGQPTRFHNETIVALLLGGDEE